VRWAVAARSSARPSCAPATCTWTPPRGASGAARPTSRCRPASTRCWRRSCARPGRILDRFQLLEHAWDYDYENRSNVVDVYVRYLRTKIDRPFGVTSIETVRGAGYRLRTDGGRPEREDGAPS
jgi:hypothetical protein